MTDVINHKALAISRLATQFTESPNLIAYIRALLFESQTLESVLFKLINSRTIDLSKGAQLDVLGSIVGQSREFVDAEIFSYFGFEGNSQSEAFGSVNNLDLGGRFRSVDEPTTGIRKLSDDEYRLYIRARISRNITKSTPEDIIKQIQYIFGVSTVVLKEGKNYYEVSIGRELTVNEKVILKDDTIIPKTAGVRVTYVSEFNISDTFFSFSGVPGGLGFGTVSNPSVGGKFANLI